MISDRISEFAERLRATPRVVFRLVDGLPVPIDGKTYAPIRFVHQIRMSGKTIFEGTETATTSKFNQLLNGGFFGSDFYEQGAGV